MKIALISPSKAHLDAMRTVLESHRHEVVVAEGGRSRMREIAERTRPDLMLVEGMCRDPDELEAVERVTELYPGMAVMLLCASHTPEFLINSMRAGVREVLPSPVGTQALEAAVARAEAKLAGGKPRPQGRVLAFIGSKGGSGATFLATNLGALLAQRASVLLIDLNLQFGDALSFVHDHPPASTLADVARAIDRLDAPFLAASAVRIGPNYQVLAAPEDPGQALEVKPEHVEAILDLAVRQYDYVLLDLGRTLDTLSVKALDRAYRIYPVMQAGVPFVRNAKKMLGVFQSLGYPSEKIEIVVNRHEKSGEIGLDDIARSLGVQAPRTVSNSYRKVNAAISTGDPILQLDRAGAVTRNLADLAATLAPQAQNKQRLLGRLFHRA